MVNSCVEHLSKKLQVLQWLKKIGAIHSIRFNGWLVGGTKAKEPKGTKIVRMEPKWRGLGTGIYSSFDHVK